MKNRSRIALLMVALFMLCAVSITANQSSSKIITLVDDKQVTHYETDAQNVQELLTQLEITLGEKDTVEPTLDTEITDNMKITIERWKPTVSVDINGEHKTQKTEAKTVGEFLTSLGLEIKEGDVVEPSTQEAITDGLQITVKTKEVKTETEDRPMSYSTEVVETADMAYGETKVTQKGKNGVKTVTLEKEYLGGELVNENVKDVVVKEEPVNEVVLKGTYRANSVTDVFTGESYTYTKVYDMEATAYTISDDGWSNKTASGMTTFVGMVAVDPNVIPLGTKLYIEGYGIAIAGDTGGAIKGNIVDLFFNSESECYQFGRQHGLKVYVLKDQNIDVKAERRSY
ncbi:MAG: DUF348 domain-containing protein [Cellulosilyticum sp.]|nr:DUF348 domain-containing protein [Cellulosilyticum sp.]